MVGQSEHIPVSGMTTTETDRGIRETMTTTLPSRPFVELPRYHYYWGSVIGGSAVAFAVMILSYSLMFACRGGVASYGNPTFGWGTGVWSVITACLAFFFGGYVASMIGEYSEGGWL